MARGKGFCLENVERGAPDSLLGEPPNHCPLVDHRSAPYIDDDGRALHGGKFCGADQAPRIFRQRGCYRDVSERWTRSSFLSGGSTSSTKGSPGERCGWRRRASTFMPKGLARSAIAWPM